MKTSHENVALLVIGDLATLCSHFHVAAMGWSREVGPLRAGCVLSSGLWSPLLPVAWVLKIENHLLVKTDIWVPPQRFYFNGLEVGLIICISSKFPGDADAAGPGTHFESSCRALTLGPPVSYHMSSYLACCFPME